MKSRDPISRLLNALTKNKVLNIQDFDKLKKELQIDIDKKAWEEQPKILPKHSGINIFTRKINDFII